MVSIPSAAIYLLVCIWATFFVSRRIEDSYHRIVYYLLIWLVPFLGAFAAILIAGLRAARKEEHSSDEMLSAIVDVHKNLRD